MPSELDDLAKKISPKILEAMPVFFSLLMIIHEEQEINHKVMIDCEDCFAKTLNLFR